MNTFKMQCINYLLVNGWEQDEDGQGWSGRNPISGLYIYCDNIGDAIGRQLEWDDEGPN